MNRRDVLRALAAVPALPVTGGTAMAQQPLHVRAEEDPHEATLMMWPNARAVYPDRYFLQDVQQTIVDIANTIAQFEPVILLADARAHAGLAKRLSQRVTLWDIPTEDLWARDAGPLIAHKGGARVVSHIRFNGWGNRQVHRHDGQVADAVAARMGFAMVDSGVIGEAGGAEHDGHGLLMAHESSWAHDNRNPALSRDEIERRLLAAYGASRMIWAPGARDMDITDYHIDALVRFTGPARALMNLPYDADPQDPFAQAAHLTYDALQAAGVAVEVIAEPQRPRVKDADFVASYANYYACNGAIIAAAFGDAETDAEAAAALARHYPGREIVALNVDALGEIGGGIHCATQQVPSA